MLNRVVLESDLQQRVKCKRPIAAGLVSIHVNTARLRIFNSELGLGKRLLGLG